MSGRMDGALVRRLRSRRDEGGAVAVLFVIVLVLLLAAAAIGVDIASNVASKQQLHDTLDLSAHAAALDLPDNGTAAAATARAFAQATDPDSDPDSALFCVVASTAAGTPSWTQMPSTCAPGPAPYNASTYPVFGCNDDICALPCDPTRTGAKCNTISVWDTKTVDFDFAPVIGHENGTTGQVVSSACRGSCGEESPNPMDVVIMADRTPSMATTDRQAMIAGIRSMLTTMDPDLQYVALGTLHKSRRPTDPGYSASCIANNTAARPSSTSSWETYAKVGTWIPVAFSKDYVVKSADPTQPNVLNNASRMAQALSCIYSQPTAGAYGTQIASAMKAATRYALGLDGADPEALGPRPGTPRKVVIFETDGSPDETWSGGSTSLTSSGDVAFGPQVESGISGGSDVNGVEGCQGFLNTANAAKQRDVLVITIGFGKANSASCKRRDSGSQPSPYVRNYLAAAASPAPDGSASTASTCDTPAKRTTENTDGDFYFCATSGSELADIFKAAIAQASNSVRYIRLP